MQSIMLSGKKGETLNPIRVLYIHHRPELGGAPTSLLMLLREMAKKPGMTFRVLCPNGPVVDMFRREGFDVRTIPVSGFYHVPGNKYQGLRWLLFLREILRLVPHIAHLIIQINSFKPNVIHLNEAVLIPAGLVARFRKIPTVWHVRVVLDNGHFGIRRNLILKVMKYAANTVIAISEDVASSLNRVPVIVVHNSVDVEKFNVIPSREQAKLGFGIPAKTPTVTMVSRIDPIKGSYDFVKIASLVKEQISNARFIIAGGGLRGDGFFNTFKGRIVKLLHLVEDRESIFHSLISKYRLQADFLLLGDISDIERVYAASDVVVFPSYLRSISRAGLEAAASGVPMIATTTNYSSDVIINGETGFLLPQGDVQAVADTIAKLLKDPKLRQEVGQNARSHALEHFAPHENANKVYDIYCSVIRKEKSSAFPQKFHR